MAYGQNAPSCDPLMHFLSVTTKLVVSFTITVIADRKQTQFTNLPHEMKLI